jgi:hypothetical protein
LSQSICVAKIHGRSVAMTTVSVCTPHIVHPVMKNESF